MNKTGTAGYAVVVLVCLVLAAQAQDWKSYQILLEGAVHTDIPYGIYHLHNKMDCDQRDYRCDYGLSWWRVKGTNYWGDGELNGNDPVAWEVVPMGDGRYMLFNKWGCDTSDNICNSQMGKWEDQVTLARTGGLEYKFSPSRDLSKPNQWLIQETLTNQYISIYGEEVKMRKEDKGVEWELWIDINYVDEQLFTDVIYDLSALEKKDGSDIKLGTKTVINNDDKEVASTIEIDYEISETRSFTNSIGVSVGSETTFKVGIPLVSSAETSVSSETSYSSTWGEETSTTTTFKTYDQVMVDAHSSQLVTVEGTAGVINVPYKASLTIKYTTGDEYKGVVEGIYEGTTVFDVVTVVHASEPLRSDL